MTQITNEGFSRTRLDGRIEELKSLAREIFGHGIDLSDDTMDGQHIAIFAEAVARLDELAEAVWISFDPDSATGHSLSRVVKINGIERNRGAKSVVSLKVTGKQGTFIPKGTSVTNKAGDVTVYTIDDVRIGEGGFALVVATTEERGAVSAPRDSLTAINQPIYGWDSVTNPQDMVRGLPHESDESLRRRRRKSISKGNRNMVESLWAALSDLPDVIEVSVLENATQYTDTRGLPPHSIHAVVLGGDPQKIAKTIWVSKTGGTPLVGTESEIIVDELGNEQVIRFSRPVTTGVRARVDITPLSGYSYSTENAIKRAVAEFINNEVDIGGGIINSALYSPLNEIGSFAIEKIELAKDGEELAERSIYLEFNERATIGTNDIEVA